MSQDAIELSSSFIKAQSCRRGPFSTDVHARAEALTAGAMCRPMNLAIHLKQCALTEQPSLPIVMTRKNPEPCHEQNLATTSRKIRKKKVKPLALRYALRSTCRQPLPSASQCRLANQTFCDCRESSSNVPKAPRSTPQTRITRSSECEEDCPSKSPARPGLARSL